MNHFFYTAMCYFKSLLSCLLVISQTCVAQQPVNKQIQSKELGEAIIQQKQLYEANRSVHPQNIYFGFIPSNVTGKRVYDSLFFATRYPALDTGLTRLSSIELKLADFDTSVMDIMCFVLQENEHDTVFYMQKVDINQLGKRHKLKLYLDQPVYLKPAGFYLGYHFNLKKVDTIYHYRLYANMEQEGGVVLHRNASGFSIYHERNQVFPFKAFYYKP